MQPGAPFPSKTNHRAGTPARFSKGDEIMDIKPGKYRHFKGKEYRVIGIANHSETLEPMVVYQALYGEKQLWVRPAAMWNETVDKDGYLGPRFQYINED